MSTRNSLELLWLFFATLWWQIICWVQIYRCRSVTFISVTRGFTVPSSAKLHASTAINYGLKLCFAKLKLFSAVTFLEFYSCTWHVQMFWVLSALYFFKFIFIYLKTISDWSLQAKQKVLLHNKSFSLQNQVLFTAQYLERFSFSEKQSKC